MTKSIKLAIAISALSAVGGIAYILLKKQQTEVESDEEMTIEIDPDDIQEYHYESQPEEDLLENVETIEVSDWVEEDVDAVKEKTKEIISDIKTALQPSTAKYNIPPYEISHETFLSPDSGFTKLSVFYDGDDDIFRTVYNEECKPFIFGSAGEEFKHSDASAIYIRNENLGVDYAVYKAQTSIKGDN